MEHVRYGLLFVHIFVSILKDIQAISENRVTQIVSKKNIKNALYKIGKGNKINEFLK